MQVVGYETPTGVLLIADDETVERIPLERGQELCYRLGDRRCAGVIHEGRHTPCDAGTAPHCREHTVPWSVANNADSDEDHAIYLAAFAPDVFKVGVTRTWRVEERLREQGADRAAHLDTVRNGQVARQRETAIATDEGLTERVRVPTKINGLDQSVDMEAWERLLEGFDIVDRFAFEYGFEVERRPVPETILTGTVRGTKGRILLLDRAGSTYAVDMRDLVGYELEPGEARRDIQSSLGAFE